MEIGMKRFVVGMDASECAIVALRWAADLAVVAGAEIIAVHAFQPPYSEVAPDDHDRLVTECDELLVGPWTDPARQLGATVRSVVEEGDPRGVVLAAAEAEHADMVVVGRSGTGSSPGLLHAGSVAEYVAHHTKRPLAVIPIDATIPTRHLVVGADGSPESLRSVLWAAQLGHGVHASVVGVVTHERAPARPGMCTLAEEWKTPLTAVGVSIEAIIRNDERAVDALLDAANELDADALVVGIRGVGGVSGLRFGGIAIQALHRTGLPIILVPPAEIDR
jgi:nucleotide-binding universal stress UspA family protein